MQIGYQHINPMITQSNSKMAHIHHLGPSEPELEALRTGLDENLVKGFIQPSKSPVGARQEEG